MMVFKTANSLLIPYGSLGLSSMQIEMQKDTLVDKNLSKGKNNLTSKKQKVLKCVAFLTAGEDRLNVNRTVKNIGTGSDKRFK